MSERMCLRCPYYLRRSSYCALRGMKVPDPNNPPCIQKEIQREIQKEGLPLPAEAPTVPPARAIQIQQPLMVTDDVAAPQATPQQLPSAAPQATHPSLQVQPPSEGAYEDLQIASLMGVGDFDYARTGIPELDAALGGGFIRGKTYLTAGETGVGKTIFSMQFLLTGALYYDEPGVYVAIDEPTDQLIKGLKRFGWDVTELIKQRVLTFLDMRTHFSKVYLREERRKIEPKYIIESIINATKKVKARRLVIDPIAPLIYSGTREDALYVREFLREMVFALESLRTLTTVMTSEVPTNSKMLSRFGVEEFLATGIIVLSMEEIGGEVARVMHLRKARWAPAKLTKLVFDIEAGKGIVIKGRYSDYLRDSRFASSMALTRGANLE